MSDAVITQSTDLAVIRTLTPEILFQPGKVDEILSGIETEARKLDADVSSPHGRDAIRSMAYKVARSKTALDKMGKDLTEEWRTRTAAVNAERRVIVTRLDALADEVRAPLTDFENAEKERIASNEAAITALDMLTEGVGDMSSEQITARAATIEPFEWSIEFRARGAKAAAAARAQLEMARQAALRREDEAEAERERLAAEAERQRIAAEVERQEREERIAAEAAERAKADAEAKAAREAKEAEERSQAVLRAAEALRAFQAKEADRKEREAAEAMAHAEQKRLDDLDAAERRRRAEEARAAQAVLDAERAAKVAEEKAERDQKAAIEAERQRVAREAAARKAEDERRAADKAHRAAINREALADLIAAINDNQGGELSIEKTEDIAKAVITWVAKGHVRHLTIGY